LYQTVKEKEARLDAQQNEITALKHRLAELERKLNALDSPVRKY